MVLEAEASAEAIKVRMKLKKKLSTEEISTFLVFTLFSNCLLSVSSATSVLVQITVT